MACYQFIMQYIFLSHDVDWRKQGPPREHVLSRAERFEKDVIDRLLNSLEGIKFTLYSSNESVGPHAE